MFIHIGDDNVIRSEEVIAIIDNNLVSSSTINEKMLFNQRKNKKVFDPQQQEVSKSVVITTEYIYYSPLSVLTLKKRASMISTISKLEDYSEAFEE
ncbi:extracellular matrix regulator RemB [Aquibacillus rhizosphaerae]|uniref:DUF370 domain-containing protein n=1 Tax=Aquibacillus rhizosphaerae TaxID=3051431 RepID=A0ABT7L6S7_9BACI|nr:DUF370 domain-containing protein [Aquibacillus sp. LR5S19]MDL4840922.1 DUF370 domain-containing protein [Aquibacillus sp. LR5S19]